MCELESGKPGPVKPRLLGLCSVARMTDQKGGAAEETSERTTSAACELEDRLGSSAEGPTRVS